MPLFEGIVSDLFPGVKLPEPDYDNLTDSLVHSIETMDLQPVNWFITKIIQVMTMFTANLHPITVFLHIKFKQNH